MLNHLRLVNSTDVDQPCFYFLPSHHFSSSRLPPICLPPSALPLVFRRCKFFSLTETPENYTVVLDEEGFKGKTAHVQHRYQQKNFLVLQKLWCTVFCIFFLIVKNPYSSGCIYKATKHFSGQNLH